MPQTITGANTGGYDNTAQVPGLNDIASPDSVVTPFQKLLNNGKWLFDKLITNGVEAIRTVADTTALRALTGMANGGACVVRGQGLYVYLDPSATAESLPWVVAPTAGTGRWVHTLALVQGASNGLATLGAGGKVPPAQVTFGAVASAVAAGGSVSLTNTYQTAAPCLITLAGCLAGDVVDIDAYGEFRVTDNSVVYKSRVFAGAGNTVVVESQLGSSATLATGYWPVATFGRYTCTAADAAAGSVNVALQASYFGSGSGSPGYGNASLRARLLRP